MIPTATTERARRECHAAGGVHRLAGHCLPHERGGDAGDQIQQEMVVDDNGHREQVPLLVGEVGEVGVGGGELCHSAGVATVADRGRDDLCRFGRYGTRSSRPWARPKLSALLRQLPGTRGGGQVVTPGRGDTGDASQD